MKLPSNEKKAAESASEFRHQLSSSNQLVQSSCGKCRSFVAASASLELLEFVEKLHACAVLAFKNSLPAITHA